MHFNKGGTASIVARPFQFAGLASWKGWAFFMGSSPKLPFASHKNKETIFYKGD